MIEQKLEVNRIVSTAKMISAVTKELKKIDGIPPFIFRALTDVLDYFNNLIAFLCGTMKEDEFRVRTKELGKKYE